MKKEKNKKLANLIDQFLESKIEPKSVLKDPLEFDRLINVLEKNLWPSSDSHWRALTEDDPGPKDLIHVCRVLTNFWEKLKREILSFKNLQMERDRVRSVKDAERIAASIKKGKFNLKGLGSQYFDALHAERTSQIELKLPQALRVNISFEGGVIDTYYGEVNALHAFINLIHGTPLEAFRQCKDEGCGHWFILTSKHKRDFCSQLCAARYNEGRKRAMDREKFRRYHREYYQKYLKRAES